MTQPAEGQPPVEDIDAAVEETIALCDGDLRAAVKVLLVLNGQLGRELALARVAVSSGFSRQWHHRRGKTDADPS